MDEIGGAVDAVEQGFVQGEIDEAAFRYSQEVESGERVIVGVNRYEEAEPEPIELHRIDPEAERRQLERTARVRAERDAEEAAEAALAEVRDGREGDGEPAPADARGAAGALHRRRDLQRAARGVRHVRRAASARLSEDPSRLADVSRGPDDPDLGVFVQGMERALAARGHESSTSSPRGGVAASSDIFLAREVRQAARRFEPDVVYAHFLVPTGLSAVLFGGAPTVVTAHGRDVRNIGAIPVSPPPRALVARRASALIAVSDYLRRELEAKIPESRGKTEVVDCGVDLFSSRHVWCLAPDRPERPVFVCVGSSIERKNVVRLADAFARLDEGRLVFVGDGPLRGELEGRDRVEVTGRIAHEDVPATSPRRQSSANRP